MSFLSIVSREFRVGRVTGPSQSGLRDGLCLEILGYIPKGHLAFVPRLFLTLIVTKSTIVATTH